MGERERFGWASRVVDPKVGVCHRSEGSQHYEIDIRERKSFLFHIIRIFFPDFSNFLQ